MTEKLSNLSRVLFDKDAGDFFVGNDITFDGEVIIQQFVQSTPSDTWRINLNIEAELIQSFIFIDNDDGTFSQIQPAKTEILTSKFLEITFSIPVKGFANILLSSETQELILMTPTPTPTVTPTVTATVTPTITPTNTVTPTVTPSVTPP